MGVYIRGMEMPPSCWRCTLSQLYEKPREMLVCKITHEEVLRYKIDSNCPLVPIPPHGRLIDADALEQDAYERLLMCCKYDNQFQKPYEMLRAIALAPTIIPAEESE